MAMWVAGRIYLVTQYYATKLGEEFQTYKTAQFGVWDMKCLE